MREEIGYEFKIKRVASFPYFSKEYTAIFTIYTSTEPINLETFNLDKNEIQFSKSFSRGHLERLLQEKPEEFSPTFREVIRVFLNHTD
jgi:hypothetical protein